MFDERDPEFRRIMAPFEEIAARHNAEMGRVSEQAQASAKLLREEQEKRIQQMEETQKKREEELAAQAEAEKKAKEEAERKAKEDGEEEPKKGRASLNEVWGRSTSQSPTADDYGADFGFEGDDDYYAEEVAVVDKPEMRSAPAAPAPKPAPVKEAAPVESYDDDDDFDDGSWLRG